MSSRSPILARATFRTPRLSWRGLLRRLLALDILFRERNALEELDPRMLRDIGLTCGDVAEALARPDAHLRSILLRGGDQF